MRAGLCRHPGHVRADRRGPRLRLEDQRRRHRLPQLRVRLVRRLRAGLPDLRAAGALDRRARHADPLGRDHLRLLRRRLLVPRRGEGRGRRRRGRADDARRRTAAPTRATAASRAASPTATPPTRTARCRPMVRDSIDDEWRKVSWDEAIARIADGFRSIQAEHGVGAIGGISSSRCTNEEVYVVQKMVRAAFDNNNIDTCARVCHSPTGYGLSQTFGTSAGTQDFASVDAGRRHPADRCQPDRRPPGVRLADEEAPAGRRPADRRRPAADRPGPQPPRGGDPPPAPAAGLQRRLHQRDGERDRHRGAARRGVPARSAARTSTTTSPSPATRPTPPRRPRA